MKKYLLFTLMALVCSVTSAIAETTISVGQWSVPSNSSLFEIAIPVQGNDLLTDMVFRVHIGDGGTEVGGQVVGPRIVGLAYEGTIWQNAPGGFTNFSSPGLALGDLRQVVEDNISLNVAGQGVAGGGTLVKLQIDTSGVSNGEYALNLTGQIMNADFSTELQRQNTGDPSNWLIIQNGSIVVQDYGSLQVTISPADVITAGARWRVDGGAWQNSGASVALPVGTYTVDFKAIAGWCKPADQGVTISSDQQTTPSSTYTLQRCDLNGDLKVDLTDAIIALKVLTKSNNVSIRPDFVTSDQDINNDGKIGLEELSYILQQISGIRGCLTE